ncbi:hypothetical protein HPULCUR_012143 [Helicostylum pulchrum]|uniref:Uncharacterized protein n=1 Tax=Helicostylum pulchrum TaxID=562976 RepID=A0ABP9YIC2_9FUNG
MSIPNNQSTGSTPLSSGTPASTVAVVDNTEGLTTTGSFGEENEDLLLEFETLDDSPLSAEAIMDELLPGNDMDLDTLSVSDSVNMNRIYELSSLIIAQGNSVPPHMVTELRSLRASLCELIEVQRLLNPAPSNPQASPAFMYQSARPPTVPSQLPFFQWVGHVYDTSRTIFPTLKSCVNKFEDVLNTYQLPFNDHWCRLLPLCLPIEIRAWLTDFNTEFSTASWGDFKAALNLQYGITQDAEQEAATTDLLALHMSRHTMAK